MFSSQLSLLSSTYQALASESIETIKPSSLEALLLRIVIYVSDNREDISIKTYLDNIKGHQDSWLFVVNMLSKQFTRELGLGHGCTYRKLQDIPIDVKKELAFFSRQTFEEAIDFRQLIQKFSLQKLIPENISYYNLEYLGNPIFALCQKPYLVKQMSLEGETWISTTPYAHLLLTLQEIATHLLEDSTYEESYLLLVKARLSFNHNVILDKPVGSLVDKSLSNYKKYIETLLKKKEVSASHYITLQMEYFNALLFAYKYTEAEFVLEQCKRVLNMDIEFTGKLGRRTKFQQFDTVQLVMNVTEFKEKEKISVQDILPEQLNIIPASELLQLPAKPQQQPSTVSLEEDSILYEKPKLNEEEAAVNISVLKQLLILNIIYYIYETTPKDEILFIKITSMLTPLLEAQQIPYAIKFSLLALRSLNEIPRYKNSDRALEQLQKLVDDYNLVKDSDSEFAYAVPANYRVHLIFLKIVADKVMGFGLLMTGVEMYQKAGMYEQCVEGLLSAGHKTKAIQLAKKLLNQQGQYPSPYLLCLMGDATNQISYYEKSWKESKSTYARAQRTLGRIYYGKKDFQKSIQSFKKALDVNFYNPSSWFTLGCAYLNLNQFVDAGKAFSQSISIDDSQGEGWGNLASCFIGQKKLNEAYGALSQALKYSESSLKLWHNMLGVSIKIKKFYKYMQCIDRLIVLDATRLIDQPVLSKLNQILEYRITLLSVERKRITYTYERRINKLYNTINQKIGEKEYVWKQYGLYLKVKIEYLEELAKQYNALYASNTVDVNDIIEGFEDQNTGIQTTQVKIQELREEIVEVKQKELNMAMRLGWEAESERREQVKIILQEYKEQYVAVHKQEDEDYKVFVKSIEQKIKSAQQK